MPLSRAQVWRSVTPTEREGESRRRRSWRCIPRSSVVIFVFVMWEVLVQTLHTLLPRLFLARRPLEGAEKELIVMRLYSRLAHLYWCANVQEDSHLANSARICSHP